MLNSPKEVLQKRTFDLIIVGAGPAGLTAGVYASTLKIDTFLVAKDIGGQAIDTTEIKNYMGFDFISGKDLIRKFEEQLVKQHFIRHKIDEVIQIVRTGNGFEVITENHSKFFATAVIIASGMKRKNLGVPGEERLQRKGVSYGLVHDLALYKGLEVAVVGGGNSGVQTTDELLKDDCKVTLISEGKLTADQSLIDEIKKSSALKILEDFEVLEIQGEDKVEGVVVRSRYNSMVKQISCRGVFIEIGFLPNNEFCRDLVELNEKGEIIINRDCSTSTEGIFACGDVTNAFGKRIIIASGEGAKAALSAKKYLSSKKEHK
jgi:alkyl hydroperoxide reductase subunit F